MKGEQVGLAIDYGGRDGVEEQLSSSASSQEKTIRTIREEDKLLSARNLSI